MSDLTERLRDWASWMDGYVDPNPTTTSLLREAADALEAAEQKLAAIDALHHRVQLGTVGQICASCGEWWPCPTHRILHPHDGQRDQ